MLSYLLKQVACLFETVGLALGELLAGTLQVFGDMSTSIVGSCCDATEIFIDLEVGIGVTLWLGVLKCLVCGILLVSGVTRLPGSSLFGFTAMTYGCSWYTFRHAS